MRFGRSMILDFGTNRKRVCDFLLVRHCDYGPILHRLPIFLSLSHSASSLSMFPLEFCGEVKREETRVMGLSSSEDPMMIA